MSQRRHVAAIVVAILAGFLPAQPAKALGLCLGNCTCTVGVAPITLGNYSPLSGAAVTGVGTVAVICTLLVGVSVLSPFTISLTAGVGNSFSPRVMKTTAGDPLQYNLYGDSGYNFVWGDGTGGSLTYNGLVTVVVIGSPVEGDLPVYAKIPASQNAKVGNYTDTITVSITF